MANNNSIAKIQKAINVAVQDVTQMLPLDESPILTRLDNTELELTKDRRSPADSKAALKLIFTEVGAGILTSGGCLYCFPALLR